MGDEMRAGTHSETPGGAQAEKRGGAQAEKRGGAQAEKRAGTHSETPGGAQAEKRGGAQAEKSRTRREQILDAAFNTFSRRGYRDTAMDEIAAAAETSKGGVYFHFPTKEAIFRELMRSTADRLAAKVDRAVAAETDPIAKADAALRTVFATFAGHRTMARLLFLDALGAGRAFNDETNALHERFAQMIAGYLDLAVAEGAIPPLDTRLTGVAWFGALNEVVARWLMADQPERLEETYPPLRALLLRSAGVPAERIAAGGPAA